MVRNLQQQTHSTPEEDHDRLSQLFKLHEQIVIYEPVNIPEVFGKDPDQTVAFEVALAALLATAVLSVSISVSVLELGSAIAAILLLATTVVRKMILDNSFIDTDQKMQKTTGWMQYLMILSVIYLAIYITESVFAALLGNVLLVSAGVLTLGVLTLMFVYEFTFGDLFFWAAVKFHNLAVRDDLNYFTHGLLELARTMLAISPQVFNEEHPAVRKIRYQGFRAPVRGSKQFTVSVLLGATLGILGFGALVTVPLLHLFGELSILYTVLAVVLLGGSSLFLQSLLQFLLSRYGNASFEEVSGLREDILPVMIVLSVALIYEIEPVIVSFG
ncbi:hypothetical protein [Halohasta litorea]|uniref:Uncharacterized protein n=1 Tax=Halohasta litorea TaxID=869891 RepID=A0ABD6D9L1_9EURY|nr:hypothetical protein [Halohasta litorea]